MRVSNIAFSFAYVSLASALTIRFPSDPVASVTSVSAPVAPVADAVAPFSAEAAALLSKLVAVDTALTSIKNSISNFEIINNILGVPDVSKIVEIIQGLGNNGILYLAINHALLEAQSLNVKLTSDESKRILEFFKNDIAQHYADAKQLLEAKKDDLRNASLRNNIFLKTFLGGKRVLESISGGLKLCLVNQEALNNALINILDPGYQTAGREAADIIEKALNGSIRVVV